MFDIGFGEMILLAAIALIAIGPKQLPEVARVVGRMLNEFKRATGDFTRTVVEARDSTQRIMTETQQSVSEVISVTRESVSIQPAGQNSGEPTTIITQQEITAQRETVTTQTSFILEESIAQPVSAQNGEKALDADRQLAFAIDLDDVYSSSPYINHAAVNSSKKSES